MRKFLNDVGIKDCDFPWNWNEDDKRQSEWKQKRKEYGFDERDTWSLKYTLTLLTYERLMMFERITKDMIVQEDPLMEYEFEGEKIYQYQAIKRILNSFREYLKDSDNMSYDLAEYIKCWALLGVIMPGLWW